MADLSRRNLIRQAAVVTGAAVVASATGALADTAVKRSRHGDIRDIKQEVSNMSAPQGLYIVNYFPVNHGGYEMWSNYNGPQYQADMQVAKNLGFNAVRVTLAARNGVFDFSSPTQNELTNTWRDFYNRSKKVGIKLYVTLFDWWSYVYGSNTYGNPYGRIADSKTWLKALLGALPDFTNIAGIELQNETKFASTATYSDGSSAWFDSGWPSGTPKYSQVGQVALVWAQQMTAYTRSLAPGIPVTVSCTNGTADLAAYVNATKGTSSKPDFYNWHCYEGNRPQLVYSALQAAIAAVGDPTMLLIGETGATSTPSGTQGSMQAQQQQADYIQAARWSCAQLGLSEPAPWALFDMNASAQFPSGNTYGLYDVNDVIKLAGKMYQAYAPGSTVPSVDINGMMADGQVDSNGNTVPARWFVYKGPTGTQPITVNIDANTLYQGQPAVLLTGSGGSSGSNPPALQINPCTSPYVSANQSYTFSVALMASAPYGSSNGSPNLEISWYDATGKYISSTNGLTLTLTGSFVVYSLTGTAPANAVVARLSINTKQNTGNIWASGAKWA